jgi:S-adenosylmethionine:diacylglycerol 3-amino-3-carboxypropyl transferase
MIDMIYYSHVNEDSRVERGLMQPECSHLVAVAGSGERVLALMDNEAVKNIVAVDLNKDALHLLQLKVCMLSNSKADEYLEFIGHRITEKDFRKNRFEKIKAQLTAGCREYWEQRIPIIENGILNAGHFEIFLEKVRPFLNLFLGKDFMKRSSQVGKLSWIAVKWKIVSWFFSQRWVYRLMGNKDMAFISTDASVGQIPATLTRLMGEGRARASFITHLVFNGHLREMEESDLPPSLKEKSLNTIRQRLIKGQLLVKYYESDLLEYVCNAKTKPDERIFYSVSDILSFEDHVYLENLIRSCLKNRGNQIIIRSFLRNRLTPTQLQQLSATYGGLENLDEKESTGMYQVVALKS